MTALFDAFDLLSQGAVCLEESADADHPGVRSNALAEARRLWTQAEQIAPEDGMRSALRALRKALDATELLEFDRGRGRAEEYRESALSALAIAEASQNTWSHSPSGERGPTVAPRVIAALRAWIHGTAMRAGLR